MTTFAQLYAVPDLVVVRLVAITNGRHASDMTFTSTPNPVLPTSDHAGAGCAEPVLPTVSPARAPSPDAVSGLGDFTWAQIVTLAGALIAAGGVILTLLFNAAKSRRDALATLYANALGAVADYLEGPYRIMRKDGEATTRFAITSKLSDVKTSIDHHQALLRLHADTGVADSYDAFVKAAKIEAGKQMHEAWKAAPITADDEVNLHTPLPRGNSESARDRLLAVMQTDLARRWYNPKSRSRYRAAVEAANAASRGAIATGQLASHPDDGPDSATSPNSGLSGTVPPSGRESSLPMP